MANESMKQEINQALISFKSSYMYYIFPLNYISSEKKRKNTKKQIH